MLAVSLLASILFLGAWHGPIPIASMLGLTFDNGFWFGIAGNVLGTMNIIFKGVVSVTVMMWVRWTLPRLRIDQVITTCLKYCVPIAALAFLGATWWQYMLPNRTFFGAIPVSPTTYQLAELLPDKNNRNDQPADEGAPDTDQTAATSFAPLE
jgi:NADH-quinone oxidoreductase subunit H